MARRDGARRWDLETGQLLGVPVLGVPVGKYVLMSEMSTEFSDSMWSVLSSMSVMSATNSVSAL